ncbi:hypothetical protein AZ46_0219500 [Metabacillus indicus LMG 22858]|nr:hypothetical protein AZ46_0219500 [Metabacillus indicus LMG 22858]
MDFQKILKSYMTIKTVLLQDGDIVIQEKIYFVLDVKKPRMLDAGLVILQIFSYETLWTLSGFGQQLMMLFFL